MCSHIYITPKKYEIGKKWKKMLTYVEKTIQIVTWRWKKAKLSPDVEKKAKLSPDVGKIVAWRW